MTDFLNPDSYSLAAAEPYRQWSPYPEWMGGGSQMLLNAAVNYAAGNYAGPNYGFMHQGNLHNNMQQQGWLTRHNLAIQTAAVNDTDSIVGTMRGMAAINNISWDKKQEEAAHQFASWATGTGAPMMLQTEGGTQLYDTLLGGRSKAVMTKYAHQAGQYMNDPRVYSDRFSVESAVRTGDQLHEQLFGGSVEQQTGTNRWRRTSGLTSHDVGGLMQEMTMRGQLRGNTDFSGLTGKMGDKDDPLTKDDEDLLVNRNTSSIKKGLESRFKAVKALKEIFGDAGQPNAPMKQLLDSLESFTGGSQQLSLGDNPQRLEMIVRNLNNASKVAGISLQATSALMGATSQQLQSQGINQAFTPQIVQEQLLQRAALQRSGAMSTPAWGLYNVDQLSQLHNQQMQGAVKSEFGNFLGAAARLKERGLLDETTDEGKKLNRILIDAEKGIMGKEGIELSQAGYGEFQGMLQKGFGLGGSAAETELRSRNANQEYVHKSRLGKAITTFAQPAELGRQLGFTGAGVAYGVAYSEMAEYANDKGIKIDNLDSLTESMTRGVWDRLQEVDSDTLHDTNKRNHAMSEAMKEALREDGGEMGAAILADPNGRKMLAAMSERIWNEADEQSRGPHGRGPGLINVLTNNRPEAIAAHQRAHAQTRVNSYMQSVMADEDRDSPVIRMIDSLTAAGYEPGKDNLGKVLKESFGFKDADERARLMQKQIDAAMGAMSGLREAAEAVDPITGEELTDEQKALIDKKRGAFDVQLKQIQTDMQQDQKVKDAFEQSAADIEKSKNETAAMSGGGSADVSFQINELHIDGTKLADAKGKATGAKMANSRGTQNV